MPASTGKEKEMNAINQLLDEAKEKAGIKSDNAFAIRIGMSRQSVSAARKGRTSFDAYARHQLSEITGRSRDEIDAMIELETEKDPKKLEYWKGVYKTFGEIAASFLLVTAIVTSTIGEAPTGATVITPGCVLCKIAKFLYAVTIIVLGRSKNGTAFQHSYHPA